MVKDRRRFTLEDKWIIGGDGTWKDLLVVSPYTKLAIDIFGALLHPRKYYRFKRYTLVISLSLYGCIFYPLVSGPRYYSFAIYILIVAVALHLWTKLYRHIQIKWRDWFFTHRKSPNEPFVPLDKSGDPRSAILLKRSVLIGGDSGTGKSNAVWEILEGLLKYKIPFRLTVLDPAGGVELSDLEHAPFTIRYIDRPTDADSAIIDFRDRMNARLKVLKSIGLREFDPTHPYLKQRNEQWHYMLVDELLLCAAQIKQGVLSPLGEILAVGRKAGFLVIACTQLGQKTTLGDFRDLFPQRVCFGTKTSDMTDAVLGTGATASGAPCHLVEKVGTGYLYTTKARGYFKFHTRHIKNTHSVLARAYTSGQFEIPNTPMPTVNPPTQTQTTSAKTADGNFRPHKGTEKAPSAVALLSPVTEPRKAPTTNDGEWALYKLFSNDGVLVYVDIASDPSKAIRKHQKEDEWFELVDPSKTLITRYPAYDTALDRKVVTIQNERPLWNVVK